MVVLTFEPVTEILNCDHRNKSYGTVLFYEAVYYEDHGQTFDSGHIPVGSSGSALWVCVSLLYKTGS